MTGLTGLTVWGETVKKVKTVRTKNYIPASRDIGWGSIFLGKKNSPIFHAFMFSYLIVSCSSS